MKLASGTVLGLAAVASSPALWDGLVTQELPVDVALTRFLLTAVAVWVGLSVLGYLVGAPTRPAAPAPDTSGPPEPASVDEDRAVSA